MGKGTKAILLVDHGSRLEAANAALEEIASLVASQSGDFLVEVAHMELAEPSIREGLRRCVAAGATDITVHPYMLGPGRHATRDIPRLVREAAREFPHVSCRVTPPLGVHSLLAEVVLVRVREARVETERPAQRETPR